MATGAVSIRLNCPVCKATAVSAQCREEVTTAYLWYVIPILRSTETYAKCSNCGKDLRILKLRLQELPADDPDSLDRFLQPPASPAGMLLAVLSLVTFPLPVIGLAVGIWSWRVNRHSHGLSFPFTIATTLLAGLITIGFLSFLAMLLLVPEG